MMDMSTSPREARIAVVGAGPAGLTCARILQKHGLDVTVYDRDSGPDARNQGGTLDLDTEHGQNALREAGLLEQFFALARPEGQEMRKVGPTGELLGQHLPEPDEMFKPEIDRGLLRNLLLDSLEPGTVRWGKALASVQDGRRLHFTDGTQEDADLVIGADGASSRVRAAVSSCAPLYSGISFLEAWFDDVEARHTDLADLVGQGLMASADGSRALFAQRNGGDHIRVYIIQKVELDWISRLGLTIHDTAGIRAHLLGEFAGWGPRMTQMLTDNDGVYVNRPIFALPAPYGWEHSPTLTLLGDAAHVMPPIGVGVNLALHDAHDLALALAGSATVEEALTSYEKIMLERSDEIGASLGPGAEGMIDAD
ncbi:monooxygenase [Kineosporia sp. NBRC 101731]|nr:monooxygenase [Kineosporia sp. NBRC 101731]